MSRHPSIQVLADGLRDADVNEALDVLQARAGGVVSGAKLRGAAKPTGGRRGAPDVHPTVLFARRLGPFKTTSEVAGLLGVEPATIRKWARRRLCDAPSFAVSYGESGRMMALYVNRDIERLQVWQAKYRSREIVPMRQGQRRVPVTRRQLENLT